MSDIIVQKNKNKERLQFSQRIWHLTKEDIVVPATTAMETGAISEHQLSLEENADSDDSIPPPISILTPLPPGLPPFPLLFREGDGISPSGQGAGRATVSSKGIPDAARCQASAAPGWGTWTGCDPFLGPGWVGEGPASCRSPISGG